MEKVITLSLPDTLYDQAQQLGHITQRNTAEVLADVLELMWPTLPEQPSDPAWGDLPPLAALSDEAVLALAESKMGEAQNERLGTLQAKGKEEGLDTNERHELMALLQIYQIGQLRKAAALVEAQQRQSFAD
jgi:hypothetical protein